MHRARAAPASGPLVPLVACAAAAGAFALGVAAGGGAAAASGSLFRRRRRRPRAGAAAAPTVAENAYAHPPEARRDDAAGFAQTAVMTTTTTTPPASALQAALAPRVSTTDAALEVAAAAAAAATRTITASAAAAALPFDVTRAGGQQQQAATAAARRPTAADGGPAAPPHARAALDCPVCLGELLLPRVAPCGHSLCTPCLVMLHAHERRPACPVCRARIRVPVDRLPVNFALKTLVEACVVARGPASWQDYCRAEKDARAVLAPCASDHHHQQIPSTGTGGADPVATSPQARGAGSRGSPPRSILAQLRPAWNWCKWSVIIVTELCAFLVSLKEVIEATPNRTRRYQRIV